jgi:hypothetical protein
MQPLRKGSRGDQGDQDQWFPQRDATIQHLPKTKTAGEIAFSGGKSYDQPRIRSAMRTALRAAD